MMKTPTQTPFTPLHTQVDPFQYILHLHRETDGFITFFKKVAGDKPHQYHYRMRDINENMMHQWMTYDSYISLNSFYTAKRGKKNLRLISNLYADIDCYNVGLTPEEVVTALEADHYGITLPQANISIYSGRGLGLVWNLEPLSGLAVERWEVIQRAIHKVLAQFGSDVSVTTDAARVFRLPGSVNSKSNQMVYYDINHVDEFRLDELGKQYFGIIPKPKFEREERVVSKIAPIEKKKFSGTVKRLFTPYSLHKTRVEDLEHLISMRGGRMEGHRERLLFVARYSMLQATNSEQQAIRKIQYLNSLFVAPLNESEMLADTQSAVGYHEGDGIKLTNEKLIEWFKITPAEQKQMKTIIGKMEKRERDCERKRSKRQAAGMQTMSEYNYKRLLQKARHAKKLSILKAIYPDYSLRKLAERFGMSKTYTSELLKNMAELLAVAAKTMLSADVSSWVGREWPVSFEETERPRSFNPHIPVVSDNIHGNPYRNRSIFILENEAQRR